MRPTRGASLAALVLVAVAAPVAAYSLADDSGAPAPASVSPGNSDHAKGKNKAPKDAEPGDDSGQAADASAAGQAHAEAMKEWARCVAEAASGPKAQDAPRPPKLACGEKPMGPGKAKHLAGVDDADAPGKSGEKKPKTDKPRGPRR